MQVYDIPPVVLNQVVNLLDPFCEEQLTGADLVEALQQHGRPMLTVAEVAHRMHCSDRTVYRWIRKGRIRAVKVGGSYRVPPQQQLGVS